MALGDGRVEVTLRGLRFADHQKNQRELVGVVVPWLRVSLRSAHGCVFARFFDSCGAVMRSGRRMVSVPMGVALGNTAQRAQARARRIALGGGDYSVAAVDEERGSRRVLMWCGVVMVLGVMAWLVWDVVSKAGATWPQRAAWLSANWVQICMFTGTMLLMPTVLLVLVIRSGMVNVSRLVVNKDGLEAELHDGRRIDALWEDVVGVRSTFPIQAVRLRDGTRLRVMPGPASFALNHRMEQLNGMTERRLLARILVRCFVLCQIGGLVGAYLVSIGAVQNYYGPIGGYMPVGLGLPVMMSVPLLVDRLAQKSARRTARRARARVRRVRAGRAAE